MKKVNIAKLERELEKGFTHRAKRDGYLYGAARYGGGNFYNLDAGIERKAMFAKKWRKAVIELATDGPVTEEAMTLVPTYRTRHPRHYKATVFFVSGEPKLYVVKNKMTLRKIDGTLATFLEDSDLKVSDRA